jgi:hypothetical protein
VQTKINLLECLFSYPGVSEKSRQLVEAIRCKRELPTQVREKLSAYPLP